MRAHTTQGRSKLAAVRDSDGHPANGLETKLYPHQSILIRKINITHTTPNHHHHKLIQLKYFSSWCNKLLAKLWLQPNKNMFLQKKFIV